jgi:hypothetical protein
MDTKVIQLMMLNRTIKNVTDRQHDISRIREEGHTDTITASRLPRK